MIPTRPSSPLQIENNIKISFVDGKTSFIYFPDIFKIFIIMSLVIGERRLKMTSSLGISLVTYTTKVSLNVIKITSAHGIDNKRMIKIDKRIWNFFISDAPVTCV